MADNCPLGTDCCELYLRRTKDGASGAIAAVKDAASIVVVRELGAEDTVDAVGSHIAFRRRQHPEERRGQIEPIVSPKVRRDRQWVGIMSAGDGMKMQKYGGRNSVTHDDALSYND